MDVSDKPTVSTIRTETAGSSEMVHMSTYHPRQGHIYLPPWFTQDGEEQENH